MTGLPDFPLAPWPYLAPAVERALAVRTGSNGTVYLPGLALLPRIAVVPKLDPRDVPLRDKVKRVLWCSWRHDYSRAATRDPFTGTRRHCIACDDAPIRWQFYPPTLPTFVGHRGAIEFPPVSS